MKQPVWKTFEVNKYFRLGTRRNDWKTSVENSRIIISDTMIIATLHVMRFVEEHPRRCEQMVSHVDYGANIDSVEPTLVPRMRWESWWAVRLA